MENSMESHGIQWNSIKFSIEFHGIFRGIPFNSIEFYESEVDGILWNSMEFHGKFHGISSIDGI
jgi:hypothetical protein